MSQPVAAPAPERPPGRNDPCWCGSGRKYKKCHLASDRVAKGPEPAAAPRSGIVLKTADEIEGIRRAGQLTRSLLDGLDELVRPGVTTGEIDRWVHQRMLAAGGHPATLGYKGYTKSTCTSINEVVCHGIPGERELIEGDIVNVDVTSILDGYYGDASRMYCVGRVSEEAARLVRVTREALELGIAEVRPGGRLGDVGAAIERHARAHGYSVVKNFGGHGIGRTFHEEPFVPHFGKRGGGVPLVPGMVFTIEPMLNQGTWKVEVLDDGWTAVTADGRLSAQWEHTVAVTATGVDVLTA
ncbi:MAG TPA: type I methionyl aminopeptidase [Thermoanaerobaculia bacterium]